MKVSTLAALGLAVLPACGSPAGMAEHPYKQETEASYQSPDIEDYLVDREVFDFYNPPDGSRFPINDVISHFTFLYHGDFRSMEKAELRFRLDGGEWEKIRFVHYYEEESSVTMITDMPIVLPSGDHVAEALGEFDDGKYRAVSRFTVLPQERVWRRPE